MVKNKFCFDKKTTENPFLGGACPLGWDLVVFFLTVAGAQTLATLILKYRKQYPILEHLL